MGEIDGVASAHATEAGDGELELFLRHDDNGNKREAGLGVWEEDQLYVLPQSEGGAGVKTPLYSSLGKLDFI